MPADFNPLDPAPVSQALIVDPNLPCQRMRRGGGAAEQLDFAGNREGAFLAGPPTQMIDLDWPLLEVLWRSALPWAHAEGVPPPTR